MYYVHNIIFVYRLLCIKKEGEVSCKFQAPSLRAAAPMPASFVTPKSSPLSAMSAVPGPFFGEASNDMSETYEIQRY